MVAAAAVLVAVMVVLRRSWRPVAGRWGHLAVSGVLTNSVLLMTAHYAMVHTGAAPIALVQTLNPLLTALLAWPLLGETLRPLQWLGLVLGAAGVVLIVGLAAARSPVELNGLLLTAGGVVGLCSGTLYFGRFCRGVPMLEGTTVQLIAAAVACVVATAVFETPHADWNEAAVARGGVERGGGLAGRDGALLSHAGARYGGAGDGKFLSGAGHGGGDGLGAARGAAVGADGGGAGGVLGGVLAGGATRACSGAQRGGAAGWVTRDGAGLSQMCLRILWGRRAGTLAQRDGAFGAPRGVGGSLFRRGVAWRALEARSAGWSWRGEYLPGSQHERRKSPLTVRAAQRGMGSGCL